MTYLKGFIFSLIPTCTHWYWLIAIASKFSGLLVHLLLSSVISFTTLLQHSKFSYRLFILLWGKVWDLL